MSMPYIASGQEHNQPFSQSAYEPRADDSSLAVVTGFLDAALRLWDDDRVGAKSQIKVAAAMLHGYADQAATAARMGALQGGTSGLAPWQARKVQAFIEASLDGPIYLKDCASEARLSTSHFAHAFKATFGMTVGSYIRRRRVERAQRLMLLSQDPLSHIALACGFADQAHYCRVFRDVVGTSPKVWRRQNMSFEPDR